MEEQVVKKPRSSKAVNQGRERVKSHSVPVFDAPETDWSIRDVGDGIPTWWKAVCAPKVSKKERVRQMKNLKRSTTELENAKTKLEQRNAEYREKLREDAKKISDDLSAKKAHVDAIIKEETRAAEIDELNADLEIKRLEAERMRISAEAERERLLEEEQKQLHIREKRRKEREARLRAKTEAAELLAKEEAERAERERIAREERMRLLDEQRRAQEELRQQKAEIQRINYEEMLKRESEQQEKARLAQLEIERKELEKLEKKNALLAQEAERIRVENERIEAERRAQEEREAKLIEMRDRSEAKRIRREKRAFRVSDYEYQPYPKIYPESAENSVIELFEVCVRDEAGNIALGSTTLVAERAKLNAYVPDSLAEAEVIADLITRNLSKGTKVSAGEMRLRGINAVLINKKDHHRDMQKNSFVVRYNCKDVPNLSVERYCEDEVGEQNMILLRDHLLRFNLTKKGFLKRNMTSLSVSERSKVMLACAVLTSAEFIILIEPQAMLDAPSRLTLKELLREWKGTRGDSAMLVLTSDEAILPVRRRGKNG